MKEQSESKKPQSVKDFEEKNPGVKVLYFQSEDGKQVWLRKPSREIMRAANAGSGNDTILWNEIIIKNCMIAGDSCFIEDDDYFFGLSRQLTELLPSKNVSLKKVY
jgi:hypothetical protein